MIVGLGALTVGGGAVFGSGALSQTEAERGLEVEVLTDDSIAEEFVDVLLQSEPYSSVGFDASNEDPEELFPESGDYDDVDGFTSSGDEVSILNEDMTVTFGPLLGTANNSYENLLRIVNVDDGDESRAFDVSFTTDIEDATITINDGNDVEEITVDSTEEVNVDVEPESEIDEITDGTLTIEITEHDST